MPIPQISASDGMMFCTRTGVDSIQRPGPGGAAIRPVVAIMSESERRAPETAVEFGKVLARLREQRGLNQKELAGSIGRSPSTISRLESSGRGVSRDLVDELAGALRATPVERLELLRAAGFLSEETVAMLEEPDLTRLSRLLAQPDVHPRDRRLLLRYVELALEHAAALGYAIPSPWLTDDRQ
jgi:transcriptional regulator with XRE-family HTH domain